jgi:hypothetical protein
MGVAVNGMHYTGMFSMAVTLDATAMSMPGASAMDFMLPLIIGISLITLGLLLSIFLSPSEQEMREDAALLSQLRQPRDGSALPPAARPAEPRPSSLFDSSGPGH